VPQRHLVCLKGIWCASKASGVLIADAGVHASYRNSPFCSECQRVVLQPRSARSGSCALSAKAARALNRAALETNCRTLRFHPSTSQRTKSPLCSEPRARPVLGRRFNLSWQLWKWHDRLAQSRFVSSPTHHLSLRQLVVIYASSDRAQLVVIYASSDRAEGANKSLLATLGGDAFVNHH
jgi:hypothetical protein